MDRLNEAPAATGGSPVDIPASWWRDGVAPKAAVLWRGVEAQHRVATMKLVDSLAEQALLEQLLETSKPPLPAGCENLHYLLAAPFRYRSPQASRFRRRTDAGVWYGAVELATAGAEVAYWRWRFLMDSAALRAQELISEHSFFQARVDGRCADLQAEPWLAAQSHWTAPADYSACQAFAAQARQQAVSWIAYASVRQPGGRCGAVLQPLALQRHEPQRQPTWVIKVSAARALMVGESAGWSWSFEPDAGAFRNPDRAGRG